jgi:hypothetical protein
LEFRGIYCAYRKVRRRLDYSACIIGCIIVSIESKQPRESIGVDFGLQYHCLKSGFFIVLGIDELAKDTLVGFVCPKNRRRSIDAMASKVASVSCNFSKERLILSGDSSYFRDRVPVPCQSAVYTGVETLVYFAAASVLYLFKLLRRWRRRLSVELLRSGNTHICNKLTKTAIPPCCVCNWFNSSLISFSSQSVFNFCFQVMFPPSRAPFLIFRTYASSDVDKTRQLVKVVSNVSTRAGLPRKTSVSFNSNDCICAREAAVSLSCEHSVSTVMGARFQALRISHSMCAAPTQLPVMRSCR